MTVGKVYAEALFMLAEEGKVEEQIFDELGQIAEVCQNHPSFLHLLSIPTLSIEERLSSLYAVIGEDEGIMENFLSILVEKHRINRILEIQAAYNQLYFEKFSLVEVFVTSAVVLEKSQKTNLIQGLEKKLGKNILLRERVDKSLLGGMIVQYGDTRMDNSLRTKMQILQTSLHMGSSVKKEVER